MSTPQDQTGIADAIVSEKKLILYKDIAAANASVTVTSIDDTTDKITLVIANIACAPNPGGSVSDAHVAAIDETIYKTSDLNAVIYQKADPSGDYLNLTIEVMVSIKRPGSSTEKAEDAE